MLHLKKGLDLPLAGGPVQKIESTPTPQTVAVTGFDYVGMKPTMLVKVGDQVRIGQPLFSCKKVEGVLYTSPAAGKVIAINRGARRVFQSISIQVSSTHDQVSFENYNKKENKDITPEEVRALLVESGLWAALRTRPYSKAPALGTGPRSLFITAMDTNPHAPDPAVVIGEAAEDFKNGVKYLTRLTEGKTYLCKKAGANIPAPDCADVEVKEFSGPHPAGNVGTHIHFVDPVSSNKMVWHIGYQDVIAVGKLFTTGKLSTERVVSIAGPMASNPRLLRVHEGAHIESILEGEKKTGNIRVVSGSALHGRKVDDDFAYLGRFSNQITLLEEDTKREFLGWHSPGFEKFSLKNTFVSKLIPGKLFNLTTSTHGSPRAIVPVGAFEKIMPLDILPTHLLKALVVNDTDEAQALGALELDEEDLALCTFVCSGKTDYGPFLRENLTIIEKEG